MNSMPYVKKWFILSNCPKQFSEYSKKYLNLCDYELFDLNTLNILSDIKLYIEYIYDLNTTNYIGILLDDIIVDNKEYKNPFYFR